MFIILVNAFIFLIQGNSEMESIDMDVACEANQDDCNLTCEKIVSEDDSVRNVSSEQIASDTHCEVVTSDHNFFVEAQAEKFQPEHCPSVVKEGMDTLPNQSVSIENKAVDLLQEQVSSEVDKAMDVTFEQNAPAGSDSVDMANEQSTSMDGENQHQGVVSEKNVCNDVEPEKTDEMSGTASGNEKEMLDASHGVNDDKDEDSAAMKVNPNHAPRFPSFDIAEVRGQYRSHLFECCINFFYFP